MKFELFTLAAASADDGRPSSNQIFSPNLTVEFVTFGMVEKVQVPVQGGTHDSLVVVWYMCFPE